VKCDKKNGVGKEEEEPGLKFLRGFSASCLQDSAAKCKAYYAKVYYFILTVTKFYFYKIKNVNKPVGYF
jgi:hypothetical protein